MRREEAAAWFAVLRRGVITHEECRAYDAWKRDPANVAAMAELRELWVGLETLRDRVPQDGKIEFPPVAAKTPAVIRSVRTAALLSVAASLVLAMMVDLDSAWWTSLDWWSR